MNTSSKRISKSQLDGVLLGNYDLSSVYIFFSLSTETRKFFSTFFLFNKNNFRRGTNARRSITTRIGYYVSYFPVENVQ